MKLVHSIILAAAVAVPINVAYADHAVSKQATYSISITNITHGMLFTPFIAAVHNKKVALFELGAPPSDELAHIAEAGDIGPETALLNASADVLATTAGTGPLLPGQTVTLEIQGPKFLSTFAYFSMAAMMVPSNDTFISLNAVKLPLVGSVTYFAKSYDAGSEINDESCLHVPGPFCGGEGYSPNSDGEGYVYPSPSTHGEGDLSAAAYRWSDPVAKVTISKMF